MTLLTYISGCLRRESFKSLCWPCSCYS